MNISLGSYVVRSFDGSVDVQATLDKFSFDLELFESKEKSENETIGVAIHKVFDCHMGKRIPMPYLITEGLRALNATPDNFSILSERIGNYVRNSPQFNVAKGRGGGVGRVVDLPSK
jgi:hypothetical protein